MVCTGITNVLLADGVNPVNNGEEGVATQLNVTTAGGPGNGIRLTRVLGKPEHTFCNNTVFARAGFGLTCMV